MNPNYPECMSNVGEKEKQLLPCVLPIRKSHWMKINVATNPSRWLPSISLLITFRQTSNYFEEILQVSKMGNRI